MGTTWWSGFPADLKVAIKNWAIASLDRQRIGSSGEYGDVSRLTPDELLNMAARDPKDGGGVVVGNECYCPPTSPGGPSTQILATSSCPVGSGGIGGTPVVEKTAEQLAADRAAAVHAKLGVAPRTVTASGLPFGVATTTGIIGRVVDSSGQPVAGATVFVGPPAGSMGMMGATQTATTSAVGDFSIAIRAGTYDITVRLDPYPDTVFSGAVVPADGAFDAGTLSLLVPIGGGPDRVDPCVADPTAMGCPGYTGGDGGGGGGAGYDVAGTPVKWYKNPITYVIAVPVLGAVVWGLSKLLKREG